MKETKQDQNSTEDTGALCEYTNSQAWPGAVMIGLWGWQHLGLAVQVSWSFCASDDGDGARLSTPFFLAGVAGSDGEIATCIIETLQLERRPASKGSQVQCLLPKGCHRQQNNATNVIIIKRIEISSPIVWGLMLAAGKVYLITL